jgi:small-conductance mechanosensitive channel
LANYTHGTLKTVWDGIDLTITFDSNHQKAIHIIKEITVRYSKGYTDIARRNLNQLRSQYSLSNTNVEPRIFSLLEPHGLTISTWYMTNSYATLMLRSNISADIIDAINKEDDIKIAYPTQTIDIRQARKEMPLNETRIL